MQLGDFNRKLKSYIRDAKILEKTDPERARTMWLKIAEFALEFSKQPGIDHDFKMRLWNQINIIIKNVKENGPAVQPKQKVKESHPSRPSKPVAKKDEDEGSFELPSVPEDDEDEESELPDNSDLPTAPSDEKATPQQGEPGTPKTDFYDRIMKMENELKQMPDFIEEVNPEPYSPDHSIIPFSNSPPQENNEEPKVNVQKADKPLFDEDELELDSEEIDPYRGTAEKKEIKDPFGPAVNGDADEENAYTCPFCGESIRPGSKQCPKCGSALE